MIEEIPASLNLEHVSPATRLLEKRRRLDIVQEALDIEREKFFYSQELFKQRENKINENQAEIEKSFVKFNRFLKENDIKKQRAEKKNSLEKVQRKKMEAELAELDQTRSNLDAEANKLRHELSDNLQFYNYLENVREVAPEEFPEIEDILNRYKVLKSVHDYIKTRGLKYQQRAQQIEKELEVTRNFYEEKILGLTKMISESEKELEHLVQSQAAESNETKVICVKLADTRSELGVAMLAVENILHRCSAKFGKILKHGYELAVEQSKSEEILAKSKGDREPNNSTADRTEKACKQLDIIKSFILDFQKTIAVLRSNS